MNVENEYTFKGKYPNGETFTAVTFVKKESKCGSYIEAENIDVHYQALVAKKLNEDKTLNDCLDEAWRSFWTNIRFPKYKAPVNGTDTYLESSYMSGNTKEYVLRYVAKMASNSGNNGSSNNSGTNTWGKESAEDCPLIIDKETKKHATCGNSRFGCWVCTVVSKDKSLTAFINKGEEWLIPLLNYRNWLYNIRDNESMRMRRRQDGSIYFSKISINENGTLCIPAKGDRKKLTVTKVDNRWIDDDGIEASYFIFHNWR